MDTVQAAGLPQQNLPNALMRLVQHISNGATMHGAADKAPPGPWDSVIRETLVPFGPFGPLPDPWLKLSNQLPREAAIEIIAERNPLIWELLHPHVPLVASHAFWSAVGNVVIRRAEIMQELADGGTAPQADGASKYIARFADDICGNGIRPKWPPGWPPGPHPEWLERGPDGTDLLVVGAVFQQAAREAFSPALQKSLSEASTNLTNAALAQIQ